MTLIAWHDSWLPTCDLLKGVLAEAGAELPCISEGQIDH